MKINRFCAVIAVCIAGFCLAADEPDAKATLKSLVEKRSASFGKEKDPFASFHQGLELHKLHKRKIQKGGLRFTTRSGHHGRCSVEPARDRQRFGGIHSWHTHTRKSLHAN